MAPSAVGSTCRACVALSVLDPDWFPAGGNSGGFYSVILHNIPYSTRTTHILQTLDLFFGTNRILQLPYLMCITSILFTTSAQRIVLASSG